MTSVSVWLLPLRIHAYLGCMVIGVAMIRWNARKYDPKKDKVP